MTSDDSDEDMSVCKGHTCCVDGADKVVILPTMAVDSPAPSSRRRTQGLERQEREAQENPRM